MSLSITSSFSLNPFRPYLSPLARATQYKCNSRRRRRHFIMLYTIERSAHIFPVNGYITQTHLINCIQRIQSWGKYVVNHILWSQFYYYIRTTAHLWFCCCCCLLCNVRRSIRRLHHFLSLAVCIHHFPPSIVAAPRGRCNSILFRIVTTLSFFLSYVAYFSSFVCPRSYDAQFCVVAFFFICFEIHYYHYYYSLECVLFRARGQTATAAENSFLLVLWWIQCFVCAGIKVFIFLKYIIDVCGNSFDFLLLFGFSERIGAVRSTKCGMVRCAGFLWLSCWL